MRRKVNYKDPIARKLQSLRLSLAPITRLLDEYERIEFTGRIETQELKNLREQKLQIENEIKSLSK